ncbi:ribitol-5-phosphate dehydrogenase [Sporolactobacillus sp. THM7-7]|nr:ribitol-5-phosphate dehydrogenase [Sporolactobacillus sp. THM7-7]
MINQVYRLVNPRHFEVHYKDESLSSPLVAVRPTYFSICAADQRYYTGKRNKEVLSKKLPMALIHEAVGEVVHDPTGHYKVGTHVALIPDDPTEENPVIEENYLRSTRFHSSSCDGFMQDYVFMKPNRLVSLFDGLDLEMASFTELMSVSMHAIRQFKRRALYPASTLGVWGDGNLGFITCLFLKNLFPEAKVYLFSKHNDKAEHFSFVDRIYYIDHVPDDLTVDHAFECVGGYGSESAFEQIIDHIEPMGTIMALGVSEYPVALNTRMLLEKGLSMIGCSRSGRVDFVNTIHFLEEHPHVQEYLKTLVGSVQTIHEISDISKIFEHDLMTSWGKTVVKWQI